MLSCFVCRHAHLTLTEDTHTDDAHIFLETLKGPSYEGEPYNSLLFISNDLWQSMASSSVIQHTHSSSSSISAVVTLMMPTCCYSFTFRRLVDLVRMLCLHRICWPSCRVHRSIIAVRSASALSTLRSSDKASASGGGCGRPNRLAQHR